MHCLLKMGSILLWAATFHRHALLHTRPPPDCLSPPARSLSCLISSSAEACVTDILAAAKPRPGRAPMLTASYSQRPSLKKPGGHAATASLRPPEAMSHYSFQTSLLSQGPTGLAAPSLHVLSLAALQRAPQHPQTLTVKQPVTKTCPTRGQRALPYTRGNSSPAQHEFGAILVARRAAWLKKHLNEAWCFSCPCRVLPGAPHRGPVPHSKQTPPWLRGFGTSAVSTEKQERSQARSSGDTDGHISTTFKRAMCCGSGLLVFPSFSSKPLSLMSLWALKRPHGTFPCKTRAAS